MLYTENKIFPKFYNILLKTIIGSRFYISGAPSWNKIPLGSAILLLTAKYHQQCRVCSFMNCNT